MSEEDKIAVEKVLSTTFLALSGQEQLWQDAFNIFYQQNYFGALLILLPLMEHSLRKLFLYFNKCPAKRGVVLDNLLNPKMDDGTRNRLFDELKPQMLAALFDLYVWREGKLPSSSYFFLC